MADADLYSAGDDPARPYARDREDQVVRMWEHDIMRAARFSARKVGSEAPDELAQAARIRIWQVLRKGSPKPDEHYLRKVIANAVRTAPPVDRALEASAEIDDADAIDTALQDDDLIAVGSVRAWLNTLPAALQHVYHLLYVKEHTQREAALIMGVSQPRVAKLHRTLLEHGRCDLEKLAA